MMATILAAPRPCESMMILPLQSTIGMFICLLVYLISRILTPSHSSHQSKSHQHHLPADVPTVATSQSKSLKSNFDTQTDSDVALEESSHDVVRTDPSLSHEYWECECRSTIASYHLERGSLWQPEAKSAPYAPPTSITRPARSAIRPPRRDYKDYPTGSVRWQVGKVHEYPGIDRGLLSM